MPLRPPATGACRRVLVVLVLLVAITLAGGAASTAHAGAAAWQLDEDTPPGNPVVGSEAPGDTTSGGTNYVLLLVLGAGLILGGVGLVRLERWERDRSAR